MAHTEPQCLYRASVPVQGCTLPLPIPLLPLLAVWPVQSLSVCTVELYLYQPYGPYGLYRASVPVPVQLTSNPPMGRTACRDPSVPVQGWTLLYCAYKHTIKITVINKRKELNEFTWSVLSSILASFLPSIHQLTIRDHILTLFDAVNTLELSIVKRGTNQTAPYSNTCLQKNIILRSISV